jgi:hypothetical protein
MQSSQDVAVLRVHQATKKEMAQVKAKALVSQKPSEKISDSPDADAQYV